MPGGIPVYVGGIILALLTLLLFCSGLLLCLHFDLSILYALSFGYIIFFLYGLHYGCHIRQLLSMTVESLLTVRTVLTVFVLIGMITVSWRACGTIPYIVSLAGDMIRPDLFLIAAFLLNALLSVLIGTSFGTAATMGVICMSVGHVLGVSPLFTGGAVFSGIFFGDRCSPLSTSALVVSSITGTVFYHNLRLMARSAVIPFFVTAALYLLLGRYANTDASVTLQTSSLFEDSFALHSMTLLPAAAVILLSLLRIDVRVTMTVSIVTSLCLCALLQHEALLTIIPMLLWDYAAPTAQLAPMMNGGGIIAMVKTAALVALSCSYAGIFRHTDLLRGIKKYIRKGAALVSAYGCTVIVSILTAMIACNQTLASILTKQLCEEIIPDKTRMMLALEDTIIVIAALIPWSIAAAVPLATLDAPAACLYFAFYLYLQPLCGLIQDRYRNIHG